MNVHLAQFDHQEAMPRALEHNKGTMVLEQILLPEHSLPLALRRLTIGGSN
jgi:hypothetical protein